MIRDLKQRLATIRLPVPKPAPEKKKQGQRGPTINATSKAAQRKWTPEDTEMARRLLREQAKPEEYLRLLGRTKECARARIERLDFLAAVGPRRSEPKQDPVPVEVWIERSRRIAAPRTLTAALCGDPPPGFSALDRKLETA